MKEIQLSLSHFNFFCPVTGHQIVSEDHYEQSPATIYCYLEDEENFQFIHESMIPCLEEFGLYYHGNLAYMNIENFKSFLINNTLPDVYLDFQIKHYVSPTVSDSLVHHCIDMGYEL